MRATFVSALAGCVLVVSAAASAEQPTAQRSGAEERAEAGRVFSSALPDSALAAQRGGDPRSDATVTNTIVIRGTADNISVNNAITGNNTINGGSFAGSAGFPTVIQNSGNGVLIQNATIINMTIKP